MWWGGRRFGENPVANPREEVLHIRRSHATRLKIIDIIHFNVDVETPPPVDST